MANMKMNNPFLIYSMMQVHMPPKCRNKILNPEAAILAPGVSPCMTHCKVANSQIWLKWITIFVSYRVIQCTSCVIHQLLDCVALAKQGYNRIGSVHPSVCQSMLSQLILGARLCRVQQMSNNHHNQSKVIVCVSVISGHLRIIARMRSISF